MVTQISFFDDSVTPAVQRIVSKNYPLPSTGAGGGGGGDASAANQTTEIGYLSSIATATATTAATGALLTFVSTANSTVGQLTGAAVFTGTSEDVKDYSVIQIGGWSDQTGTLSLQQSLNGTNWDITDTYTVAANSAVNIALNIAARYYRLVYTNGATTTTQLRLTSYFRYRHGRDSSQRPGDAQTNEFDGDMTLGYNLGYNGTTWDRLRSTIAGGLETSLKSLNGVAVAVGSGVNGTGVQRVSIVTDQAAIASNNTQLNGVAIAVGTGVVGTGVARVTLATDVPLPTGTNSIGNLGTVSTVTTVAAVTAITNALPAGGNTIGGVNTLIGGTAIAANVGTATAQTQRVIIAASITPTLNSVTSTTTASTAIIGAGGSTQLGRCIYNESTSVLYLGFGPVATTSSYTVQVPANYLYEVPNNYVGAISGVWATANGFARTTVWSA